MNQDAPFSRIQHLSGEVSPSLLPTCQLILFIQSHQVITGLISPEDQLINCQEFRNVQGISSDMFLRFVFERELRLRKPYLSCQVYTSEPLFTLIPDEHFQEEEAYSLSRLMLDGTVFRKEVQTMSISSEQAKVVFSVSPPFLHLLNHYLSSFTLNHICASSLAVSQHLKEQASFLLLHVLKEHILITAYKNKLLQLCNLYPFRSIADAIYFIQLVRRTAQLDDPDIPLFVIGEIGKKGSSDTDLWEYLPDMKIPEPLLSRGIAELSETEYWRYAFLAC